jgi:hypothetical protein
MKLTSVFRILSWIFVAGGAAVILLLVEGNPAKSTLGIVAFSTIILGMLFSIASTLVRIWPKKPQPKDDDET